VSARTSVHGSATRPRSDTRPPLASPSHPHRHPSTTAPVDELTSATGAGTGDGPVPAGRRHRRPVLGRPNRPLRHRGRRRDRRRRSFDVRAGTPVRLSRRPGTGPDGGRRLPQSQHVAVAPSGWQSAGCQSRGHGGTSWRIRPLAPRRHHHNASRWPAEGAQINPIWNDAAIELRFADAAPHGGSASVLPGLPRHSV
jgi:hypothetical protein